MATQAVHSWEVDSMAVVSPSRQSHRSFSKHSAFATSPRCASACSPDAAGSKDAARAARSSPDPGSGAALRNSTSWLIGPGKKVTACARVRVRRHVLKQRVEYLADPNLPNKILVLESVTPRSYRTCSRMMCTGVDEFRPHILKVGASSMSSYHPMCCVFDATSLCTVCTVREQTSRAQHGRRGLASDASAAANALAVVARRVGLQYLQVPARARDSRTEKVDHVRIALICALHVKLMPNKCLYLGVCVVE